MKKIFVFLMLLGIIILTGCGKNNAESVFKDLTNKINKLNAYTLTGILEVKNNSNNYTYDVKVNFMQKDKYRVSLLNQANNHEQVILRNDDGVFVLTPSLNKSFKFQSDWPYNNSQIYILSSILDDLNKDNELKKESVDGKYVFTSKVNYPNNNNLKTQKVTVTEDLFIESVEVLNDKDEVEMTFKINNTDYNPTFDESYFEVNSIINSNTNTDNNSNTNDTKKDDINKKDNTDSTESKTETKCDVNKDPNCKKEDNNNNNIASPQKNIVNEMIVKKITSTINGEEEDNKIKKEETKPTATLEDVIYPLYLPTGTVLKEQEKVNKTDGERVILTFAGDKGFTLVEETAVKEKEFTVIPTYGEPGFVNDTIGAITDNSLNWISNGVEYYMVSDVMNTVELLDIANSINVTAVASLK